MKKLITLVFTLTAILAIKSNGQSLTRTFVIANDKIFTVSFQKDSSTSIITLKTSVIGVGNPQTNCLNNIDKQIFKTTTIGQIKKLLPDSNNKYSTDNNQEIDQTLDKIYDEYTKKITDKAKAADDAKIKFGIDEYYGLDSLQKIQLLQKLKELRALQVQKFNIKKTNTTAILKIDTNYKKIDGQIKALDRDLRELKSYRQFEVSLIGNATVISSFKIADQSQINGGFGIIASKPNQVEFVGIFTISQVSDTIASIGKPTQDFGTSVLIPGVRRFSLLTNYRHRQLWPTSYSNFFSKIGLAVNFNITPYNWLLKKVDGQSDSISTKVMPISVDAMLPYNWVNIFKQDEEFSISTDFGLTARYIAGNIDADTRANFLGKKDIFYWGLIAGLNIKYNGLRFQFHAPLLFGSHVDGLTGGQSYASMALVANIASIQSLFK